ncbi:MAG TPA: tRNA (adenosine(37)-N6)-threonylcarbamoyltransferase complex dimerization subunit type 1 TsaB [Thermoanaerobaculia bacterium]|nr:tRNA (adenosine(37)-N6)-threonylcarbamoyltransferase complex dimerization subunit type 1 TsaB [Thermoanaerobaculia bacterium]
MGAPGPADLVLALDAGSPQVSVALGRGGEVLAARSEAIARSSRRLLEMIDEALAEAGVEREALRGIVALRGPGSFTGLRVGLATALGLHLALGVPAAAVPTLLVLAASAGTRLREESASAPGDVILAAVDALRGEWTVQPFAGDPPRALAEAETVPAADLAARGAAAIAGFGIAALAALPGWPAAREAPRLLAPGPLAPVAIDLLPRLAVDWDPALLTEPLYARPPAVIAPATPAAPRR